MSRNRVFERIATKARLRGNQTPLFQWFIIHHDQFAAVVAGIARPGWGAIAAELSVEGLTGKDGRPITATYARQAWWRADQAWHKGRGPAAPAAQSKPAPAKQPSPVIAVHGPDDDDNSDPFGFEARWKARLELPALMEVDPVPDDDDDHQILGLLPLTGARA